MIRRLITIKNCSTDFSVNVFFIFASSFSENSSLVFLFCFFFLGNIFFFLFFFFFFGTKFPMVSDKVTTIYKMLPTVVSLFGSMYISTTTLK